MWRVICSNTARAKRTQIFAQKSIHSFCLETLETAKVSGKDEIYHRTPLETLYSLSVLLCSVHFLDLFSKWQVEGKGSKTSAIVYFRLQFWFCKLSLWQSISARIFESNSLCCPYATDQAVFDYACQESRISTCQDVIVNLTLPLLLFLVTVQQKTFSIWA